MRLMPGASLARAGVAGAVTGIALWFTCGVLDVATAAGDHPGVVRLAMLPGVAPLAGLIGLATLVCVLALARLGGAGSDARTPRILAPLFASIVLAVPFLPYLPDWLPILRVPAGPMRTWIWLIVVGQVAWAAGRSIAPQAVPAPKGRSSALKGPALAVAAALVCSWVAASRLTSTPVFPGGDEPHYLIVAQSLWRDGDLQIENNHARGDYSEYYGAALEPHYQTRGRNGAIYSIHPIGLPAIVAPVYAIGGYRAVVGVLALFGALAAALMWRQARVLTGSAGAAWFAWAAVATSAPYVLNSIAVYPEIVAAVCVMVAISVAPSPSTTRATRLAALAGQGLAIAVLPWLSTKYAPMAATLAAIQTWRAWRARTGNTPRWVIDALIVIVPFALSLAGWLAFFQAIWGSYSPTSPYGGSGQTALRYLPRGFPGLLFDQEYGIVANAPALLLGIVGLFGMARVAGEPRQRAVELGLTFGALLVTVGAFHIWWGGDAPPGRPVVSGLPLLGLPIAWQAARAAHSAPRRAAHVLLLLVGGAITGSLVFAREGLLIANGRDGVAEYLRWLSPDWPLWLALPSYIGGGLWSGAGLTLVWAAIATAAAVVVRRAWFPRDPGPAALAVSGLAAALAVPFFIAAPALSGQAVDVPLALDARARVTLWDDFDATLRPVAIAYEPFVPVAPHELPRRIALRATRGSRRAPQPLPLLFNARFALPAGEYVVELAGAAQAGTLALQLGRIGEPVTTWKLTTTSPVRQTFRLPLNASFVGFRASPELAAGVTELRLNAHAIEDAHARRAAPEILSAAAAADATVLFHDVAAWPEPAGFWTRGGSSTRVTIVSVAGRQVVLTLGSGTRANDVTLETPTWRTTVRLEPNQPREIAVPPDRHPGLTPLVISAPGGFRPGGRGDGGGDTRLLGCWVEVRTRSGP